MTDNLFDAGNQSGGMNQSTTGNDDIISQLVGEGKKFKTAADLAKGKLEADAFIEQLKAENAEMRTRMGGLEEIVKTLKPLNNGVDGNSQGVTKPPVDDGSLDEKVARALEAQTEQAKRKANLEASVAKLRETHGDDTKVREAIASRASELGMSTKELQVMAEKSPVAFLSLMGAEKKGTTPPATSATRGGQTQAPVSSSGVKNFAYFENLRKTMGSKYYDAKIQNDLFKARKELGDRFYQ